MTKLHNEKESTTDSQTVGHDEDDLSLVVGEDDKLTTASNNDEHGNEEPLSADPKIRNAYCYHFNICYISCFQTSFTHH